MKPNGRRAWRRFAKQQRRKVNRRNRQTGTPWINDADGALRPIVPARPFTARSLVGMTMGARKRAARNSVKRSGLKPYMLYEEYRIGERLRPCPGCCHCWGHRISEHGECCGPQTLGKRNSQIKAMRKWENNPQGANCDGSGVLPARRSK